MDVLCSRCGGMKLQGVKLASECWRQPVYNFTQHRALRPLSAIIHVAQSFICATVHAKKTRSL